MEKHLICFSDFILTMNVIPISTFDRAYMSIYVDRPIVYNSNENQYKIPFTAKVNGKTEYRNIVFEKYEDAVKNLYQHYYQVPKQFKQEGLNTERLAQIRPKQELLQAALN